MPRLFLRSNHRILRSLRCAAFTQARLMPCGNCRCWLWRQSCAGCSDSRRYRWHVSSRLHVISVYGSMLDQLGEMNSPWSELVAVDGAGVERRKEEEEEREARSGRRRETRQRKRTEDSSQKKKYRWLNPIQSQEFSAARSLCSVRFIKMT